MLAECPKCHKTREVKNKPREGVVCKECRTIPKRAKTLYRVCKICGDKNPVKSIAESKKDICRDCYVKQNRKDRTRVCSVCGDVKIVATRRDAEATMCKKCAGIANAKNRIGTTINKEKVKYYYFCVDCNHIKIRSSRQRTIRCSDCSRKAGKMKARAKQAYFDMNDMEIKTPLRHFISCPECEVSKEVSSSKLSGTKLCKKCAKKHIDIKISKANRLATLKLNGNRTGNKDTAKRISTAAIEKEREKNRLHREYEAQRIKEAKVKNVLSEAEMIKQFLKNNKPSVVASNEPIPHITPLSGLCVNDYY